MSPFPSNTLRRPVLLAHGLLAGQDDVGRSVAGEAVAADRVALGAGGLAAALAVALFDADVLGGLFLGVADGVLEDRVAPGVLYGGVRLLVVGASSTLGALVAIPVGAVGTVFGLAVVARAFVQLSSDRSE